MKGNTKVIDLLNKQLTLELTSMDQYLAHSKIYEDWGINKLHEKLSHEYEEELGHAEAADDGAEGDEGSAAREIGEDERLGVEHDRGPVGVLHDNALPEAVVEDAPERRHDGEEEGVAGGGEARAVQEGHEEPKADEDHDVDVLEVGVPALVAGHVGLVLRRLREDNDHREEEGLRGEGGGLVHS